MNFKFNEAVDVLQRTPQTLEQFLTGLSEKWLLCNEGEGTWNVSEVVDHLIECEKQNWIPRLRFILEEGENQPFPPFDRYAHLQGNVLKSIDEKLLAFKTLRTQNVATLQTLIDPTLHLEQTGLHPAFGQVKVRELISTWVVHDLTHTAQIVRIMAKSYKNDVGPWIEYLGILRQ